MKLFHGGNKNKIKYEYRKNKKKNKLLKSNNFPILELIKKEISKTFAKYKNNFQQDSVEFLINFLNTLSLEYDELCGIKNIENDDIFAKGYEFYRPEYFKEVFYKIINRFSNT